MGGRRTGHYLKSPKTGKFYYNPTIKRETLLRDYERTTPLRPMVAGKRRRTWQRKEKRYVQYTRSFVYTEYDDPGAYWTVDVVITERVPADFSTMDMQRRWADPEMKRKMEDAVFQMSGKVEYVSQLDVSDRRRNIGGATWAFAPSKPFFQDLKHLVNKSGAYWRKFKR